MSEFYIEQLIKVKNKPNIYGVLSLCIGIIIAGGSFVMGLSMLVMLIGVIVSLVGVFVFQNTETEYEYLFLGKEMDIDKILAKKKRKKSYTFHMDQVIVVAKATAGEVKVYQNIKYKDFSSKMNPELAYKVVLSRDSKMEGLLFEPTKELLEAMRAVAPRKVFVEA